MAGHTSDLPTPDSVTLAPSARRAAAPSDLPSIPGYEVLRRLGQGGMGVVYLARDRNLGRTVALKMIRDGETAEPADLVRFQTEAQAIAALRHPGIVQLFEAGQILGLPYFTLEYLPGGSLAERIRDTALPPEAAARLVLALAEAMACAHEHGIIHRDLKPENVLMDEAGHPKITDFGLARLASGIGLTATREVMGTPDYMAPEQARGDTTQVGPAADIWALGAILYRLVVGRPPFQAPTGVDTLRLVLDVEPISPRQLQPACPRDLETILLRCLQKAPTRRYPSCRALADDLKALLAGKPIHARPVGMVERTTRWMWRNPVPAGLLGLTLTTLLVGIVVSSVLALQARASAEFADGRRIFAEEAEKRERIASDEARLAAAAAEQSARRLKDELQVSRRNLFIADLHRLTPLAEVQPQRVRGQLADATVFPPELRDPLWHLLANGAAQRSLPIPVPPAETNALRFHPSGRYFLRAVRAGIELIDLDSLRILRTFTLLPADPRPNAPPASLTLPPTFPVAFTRDGQRLLALLGANLFVWEVHTGRLIERVPLPFAGSRTLTVNPEGTEVLLGIPMQAILVVSLVPGPQRTKPPILIRTPAFALSPTGDRLAVAVSSGPGLAHGTIEIRDRQSGRILDRLPPPLGEYHSQARNLLFSPNGKYLAMEEDAGTVRVWDLTTRTEILSRPMSNTNHPGSFRFHPTLPLIAFGQIGEILLVDLVGEGRERLVLDCPGIVSIPPPFDFHPSGRWLVIQGGRSEPQRRSPMLVDLHARYESLVHDSPYIETTVLLDRGVALLARDNGETRRLDLQTGEIVGEGPKLPGALHPTGVAHKARRAVVLPTTAQPQGPLSICDLQTGAILASVPRPETLWQLAITPDARFLALSGRETKETTWVRLHDATTGALVWEKTLPGDVGELTLHPEGKALALHVGKGRIQFLNPRTGQPTHPDLATEKFVTHLQYRPDGSLVVLRDHRELLVCDPERSKVIREIREARQLLGAFTISPDGRFAVSVASDRQARFWDLDHGSLRLSWQLPGLAVDRPGRPNLSRPQFSPDGERLVITTTLPRSVLRVYDLRAAETPEAAREQAGFQAVRYLVERLREDPLNPAWYERLATTHAQANRQDRAALYAAQSLLLRSAPR